MVALRGLRGLGTSVVLACAISACLFPEKFDADIHINDDRAHSFAYQGILNYLLGPPKEVQRGEFTQASATRGSALNLDDHAQPIILPGRAKGYGLVFSPDGKSLAVGSEDGTVKLWQVKPELKLLRTFEAHPTGVHKIAFSPSGKLLASIGETDGALKVHDTRTGELVHRLLFDLTADFYVRDVAFDAGEAFVAADVAGDNVKVWNLASGAEVPISTKLGKSYRFFAWHGEVLNLLEI